MAYLLFI